MPEFNIRSDSVNVEQIMEQIRARIREKRGVDYTEEQIRELASVKLEKFLDPRGVRSDLLDQFRRTQPPYEPPALPNYAFEAETLYTSHRAPLRWIRRLLRPILKLFFNPNPLVQALHIQSQVNTLNSDREARREATRRAMEQLYFEVLHNLVLETTRMGIEVKNLKMRVESLTGRLEFNERRARALERVVVYQPSREEALEPPTPSAERDRIDVIAQEPTVPAGGSAPEGPGQRSRRRRRRRGRRGSGSVAALMESPTTSGSAATPTYQSEMPPPELAAFDQPAGPPHAEEAGSIEPTPAGRSHPNESPAFGESSRGPVEGPLESAPSPSTGSEEIAPRNGEHLPPTGSGQADEQ
jgi:hypothetical protein